MQNGAATQKMSQSRNVRKVDMVLDEAWNC